MRRVSTLLPMLLGLLAAHGLPPEALDPWRGWVLFKHYARLVDETPDPGIGVQIRPHRGSGDVSLLFVRQVVEADEDWLRPVGGVVCEFVFEDPPATATEAEFWTFDTPSFTRFVDRVEGHPGFMDLIARRPANSTVYWEDA